VSSNVLCHAVRIRTIEKKKKKKKYGASTLAALYLPPSAITGENESEYSIFT